MGSPQEKSCVQLQHGGYAGIRRFQGEPLCASSTSKAFVSDEWTKVVKTSGANVE
jgi:hypothetical protein